MPDKVGAFSLRQCITLQAQCEHLVIKTLPELPVISVGS